MMKSGILFLQLSFYCLISFASNSDRIILPDSEKVNIENSQFQIYMDSLNTLELNQILLDSNLPFKNAIASAYSRKYNHWIKLNLRNTFSTKRTWFIKLGDIPNGKVYIVDSINNVDSSLIGTWVKRKYKQIQEDAEEAVLVSFESGEVKTLYLKLNNNNKYDATINIAIHEQTAHNYLVQKKRLIHGLIHGFLWMILLYNLFLFFSTRDKSFLYYVLYVFFMVIADLTTSGLWRTYIMQNAPWFYYFSSFSVWSGFTFYFALMRIFAQSSEKLTKTVVWIKRLIVFSIAVTLLITIASLISISLDYMLSMIFIFFVLLALVVMSILLFFKGDTLAKYFAIGTGLLIAGTATAVFLQIAFSSEFIFYAFYVGLIGEVIVFSLGLSYRFKLNEQQRLLAQEKLIAQLKENERIKDEANRMLEQKVEERTQQLNDANKELNQTNEELQSTLEVVNTQNIELEDKNRQITASITYASRIQQAILGDINHIEKQFKDAFIFFSPHSIVSGDFYWYTEINNAGIETQESSLKIIIASDCTGHGVPGAFMTVMGHDFLEEIVKNQSITRPDQILQELDKKVSLRLQSTEATQQVHDGMDITILAIDEKSKKLWFSGAKNPLYFIRNGELNIIKGSKFAIGGLHIKKKEKEYELHTIDIEPNDVFYIFSDGFQDQFSSEGRKYMVKNYRNLLVEISNLPLQEQKQKLKEELENWKGNDHQTDDVLIIGIKVV